MAAGFGGCKTSTVASQSDKGGPLPDNTAAARAAGLTDDEISAARKLYVTKCARCHKFYDPAEYDEKEWHRWMTKMSRKAHLKPDQEQLLSRYLQTFRSAPTNPQP